MEMTMAKKSKTNKKSYRLTFSWVRLTIFLIFAVMIGCTYFVKQPIEEYVADLVGYSIKNTSYGSIVEAGDLEVHFIDVGQGDSIAIRFPDDQTMLIDAGKSGAKTQLIDYLNKTFFKNDASHEFDYVLLTHSDSDHCGSMVAIYQTYQVNNSIRPYEYSTKSSYEPAGNPNGAREKDSATYGKYINAVYEENDIADDSDIIYAQAGLKIQSVDSSVSFLMEFLTPNKTYYDDANDYSPMVLLEYKSLSFLFTGDGQTEQFAELENAIDTDTTLKNRLSRVTVYKAAHHGSSLHNSNNLQILQKLNPEYVVVEVGADNSYGHPHQGFLDNVATIGVTNIYRTDLCGDILFGVSRKDGSLNLVTANSNTADTSETTNNSSNASAMSSNADAPQILYYSWEIMAGTLLFILFILCFYDYKYKKRKLEKQIESAMNIDNSQISSGQGKSTNKKKSSNNNKKK